MHAMQASHNGGWDRTFYRGGLSLASSVAIRDYIAEDPLSSRESLVRILVQLAPNMREIDRWPENIEPLNLQHAIENWINGTPEPEIEAGLPPDGNKTWPRVRHALETTLPWIATAAVEIHTRQMHLDSQQRAQLYNDLDIASLRYGIPRSFAARWIRNGLDRERVTELLTTYEPAEEWSFDQQVNAELSNDERILLNIDDDAF
jgi:hypothetical protein